LKHNKSTNLHLASQLQKTLRVTETPELKEAVNFQKSSQTAIHRWFRYREGFSPAILDTVASAKRIYDPFAGCGTTLIEARSKGIEAVGTEINPLAVFIAEVKTKNYSDKDRGHFTQIYKRAYRTKRNSIWKAPSMPLLPKMFQPEALEELCRIRAVIEECTNKKVQNLLLLSWLNILEKCSNTYKEGNGLKYRNKRRRPDAYETLPDNIWIPKYFGPSIGKFVKDTWKRQCEMVIEDLHFIPSIKCKKQPRVINSSCLSPHTSDEVGMCDAAVFSPPYANRFDYFEAFKLELWMGDFVDSQKKLGELRQKSMRNNLTVKDGEYAERKSLENFLELMGETESSVRMGIQNTLRGYFDDIYKLADNLTRTLEKGGKVVCVIGNSAYAGVVIPTDILTANIFEEAGFTVNNVNVARHLTVSSQQRNKVDQAMFPYMRESIIECTR